LIWTILGAEVLRAKAEAVVLVVWKKRLAWESRECGHVLVGIHEVKKLEPLNEAALAVFHERLQKGKGQGKEKWLRFAWMVAQDARVCLFA
jgi:hypothetical protein